MAMCIVGIVYFSIQAHQIHQKIYQLNIDKAVIDSLHIQNDFQHELINNAVRNSNWEVMKAVRNEN